MKPLNKKPSSGAVKKNPEHLSHDERAGIFAAMVLSFIVGGIVVASEIEKRRENLLSAPAPKPKRTAKKVAS